MVKATEYKKLIERLAKIERALARKKLDNERLEAENKMLYASAKLKEQRAKLEMINTIIWNFILNFAGDKNYKLDEILEHLNKIKEHQEKQGE